MADVVVLEISSLGFIEPIRSRGEDAAHIRRLADLVEQMPPILVHQNTMQVIDGVHRIRAAQLNGRTMVEARFFEGSDEAAFNAAVEANIAHGLPLSRADREAAVRRMLELAPDRSDRSIARSAGVSPTTAGAIRRRTTVQNGQSNVRVGDDGRRRPLTADAGRELAYQVLTDDPRASLRTLAKSAGISLGTARDVRDRFRRGQEPESSSARRGSRGKLADPPHIPQQRRREPERTHVAVSALDALRRDPSLRFNEVGRVFLRGLEAALLYSQVRDQLLRSLPPHCRALAARAAAECGAFWDQIAEDLNEDDPEIKHSESRPISRLAPAPSGSPGWKPVQREDPA